MEGRVEPLGGPLPSLEWRWDAETEILSGSAAGISGGPGLTGTLELHDAAGAIAVLDLAGGQVRGIDIVIWPAVTDATNLRLPGDIRAGVVTFMTPAPRGGLASLELDARLGMRHNPDAHLYHLRLGAPRAVQPVRIADRLVLELDNKKRLAGFWMEQVPGIEDA